MRRIDTSVFPLGSVEAGIEEGNVPLLNGGDPDVEALLFPHLYPYRKGHFHYRAWNEKGRSEYTCQMDAKQKLNSVNSSFHDDWYWPPWVYQAMEKTRINQNAHWLVNNKTRQAIDNRLPHYQLLQQRLYGTHSIINELITNTIPACIQQGSRTSWRRRG